MLLNHIKSRDVFSSFSEEKMDSGCGSQNSMQDSQDFLTDMYPSQTTRMYRKYMNEPPLFKPAGQQDLHHNKMLTNSSYQNQNHQNHQNLDYRKIKSKENDDRTMITHIVTAVKDSSSEVKESLQQMFRSISDLLSKNDGNVDEITERFGCEFQKQYKKLLSAIEDKNEHDQEIAEKDRQLTVLEEQVKSLEDQNGLESKIAEIITEKFSAQKSSMNDSLQRFSTSLNKQRVQPPRSFESDLKSLENQKKEFASLKTHVLKAFRDLDKRILTSSQGIVEETKEINSDINMELLMKIQDILKSCSREFYEHLREEFVDLYKEQKQEIERNMSLWNETLRLDLKNAFCDLTNSYNQSFKEVFVKISQMNNDMKGRMTEFEKELKKIPSGRDHLLPHGMNGMNRLHVPNKNVDGPFYRPFSEQKETREKSIMPSKVPAIISTPYAAKEYRSPYETRMKVRAQNRRSRFLISPENPARISPFVSPAMTMISHGTSPGVSVRDIPIDHKAIDRPRPAQYGNDRMLTTSWPSKSTKSVYKKIWNF